MPTFISPIYTADKLSSPKFEDLVDVFEDRMRGWFLEPIYRLLQFDNHDIAASALMMTYFEGIEIYFRGQDSKGRSREFFTGGFLRLFPLEHRYQNASENIVGAIYEQVRCGFAHDGIFKNRVYFSRSCKDPFWISVPIKAGDPDHSSNIESILVNPVLLYESIRAHLAEYIGKLRLGSPGYPTLRNSFEQAVSLKWALNDPPRAMGFTPQELFGSGQR